MENRGPITKMLAIAGTALVWFPILASFFFSAVRLGTVGVFQFDYLMPAELFLAALAGGGLLLWAALRARSQQRLIGWGLAGAAAMLVASQGLAVVTGLASGETGPGGWQWALVLGMIFAYVLAVILMGVGGIRLVRGLFGRQSSPLML